jgi:hypothetical protein
VVIEALAVPHDGQAVLGALEHLARHGRDGRQEAVAVVLRGGELRLAVQLREPAVDEVRVVGELLALDEVVEDLHVHVPHHGLVPPAAQAALEDREAGEGDRRERPIRRVDEEDLHRCGRSVAGRSGREAVRRRVGQAQAGGERLWSRASRCRQP